MSTFSILSYSLILKMNIIKVTLLNKVTRGKIGFTMRFKIRKKGIKDFNLNFK